MNGGDNNIDVERGPLAGRLEGDYKSFDFHFFALDVIWRFGGTGDEPTWHPKRQAHLS